MPVFFLEPFKKISFPVRPEAEIVKQTGKVFRGGRMGASWASFFQATPAAFATRSVRNRKSPYDFSQGLDRLAPRDGLEPPT